MYKYLKSLKFSFGNFVFTLFACLFIASFSVTTGHVAFNYIAIGLFLAACVPENKQHSFFPKGALRSEVIRRIFSSDLQKNLYPNNEFYKNSKVDAGVAISANSVDVPQAGAKPKVIVNPTERPIPLRIRKDDKKSYDVDLYETEPDIVTDINQAFTSYDKRAAILQDHTDSLNTRIASELSVKWFPTLAANIILTTGTNNTGTKLTGMTGNRKEVTVNDFISLATLLDNMEVPDDGNRCILIHPSQVGEIKKIAEFRDFDKTGIVGQLASGSIGKIQNMNVYKRTTVPMAAVTSNAVKPVGSAVGATDNLTILAWHPNYVRRAEGVVQVNYTGVTQPGHGGPTMNAAVVGGGMISRADEVGVAALVQGQ